MERQKEKIISNLFEQLDNEVTIVDDMRLRLTLNLYHKYIYNAILNILLYDEYNLNEFKEFFKERNKYERL